MILYRRMFDKKKNYRNVMSGGLLYFYRIYCVFDQGVRVSKVMMMRYGKSFDLALTLK